MEEEFFDELEDIEGEDQKKQHKFNIDIINSRVKLSAKVKELNLSNFRRPAYSYTSICTDKKYRISKKLSVNNLEEING